MLHGFNLYTELTHFEVDATIKHLIKINKYFSKGFTKLFFDGGYLNIKYKDNYYIKLVVTNAQKLIKQHHIIDTHYQEVEEKLNKILEPFNITISQMRLLRIDYKLDLFIESKERQAYLSIMSKLKTKNKYRSVDRFKAYTNDHLQSFESVYLKPQGNKKAFSLNIYAKHNQMFDKNLYTYYLRDVLRFEVQLKNSCIKADAKRNNLERDLFEYFNLDARKRAFKDVLINNHLYNGDHYTIKAISKKIKHLKPIDKKGIKHLLKAIDETSLDKVIREPEQFNLSEYKIKKYIHILQELEVNPIPIPAGFDIDYLKGLGGLIDECNKFYIELM